MSKETGRRTFFKQVGTLVALGGGAYIEYELQPFRRAGAATIQSIEDRRYARTETFWGSDLTRPELIHQLNEAVAVGRDVDLLPQFSRPLAYQFQRILGQDDHVAYQRAARLVIVPLSNAGEVRQNHLGEPDVFLNNSLSTVDRHANGDNRIARWIEAIDVLAHECVHAGSRVIIGDPSIEDYGVMGRVINTTEKRYGFSRKVTRESGQYTLLDIPKVPNILEELAAEVGRVKLMRQLGAEGLNFIGDAQTVTGSRLQCRCHAFLEPALNWIYDSANSSGSVQLPDIMLGHHFNGDRAPFLLEVGRRVTAGGTQVSDGNARAAGLFFLTSKAVEGYGGQLPYTLDPMSLSNELFLFNNGTTLYYSLINAFDNR